MGFLDRLFGTGGDENDARRQAAHVPQNSTTQASTYRDADGHYAPPPGPGAQIPGQPIDDEQAVERYRYLLRTAPPETIEQVHAEAFAKLTEPQRQQVLADLSSSLPAAERPAGDDPQSLARAATRAEYTQPGFMERTFGGRSFGGGQGGPGFGSMLGASMLGTIGGYVVGSALVSAFMAPAFADGSSGDGAGDGSETGADAGDAGGFDGGADAGGWGGDAGGFGDFGGGDFGGFEGF
jgi:hypothetical protein